MAFTYTRGGVPFQRFAIHSQGNINSRQGSSDSDWQVKPCLQGWLNVLSLLLATSQALQAPEAFWRGTREESRAFLLSAQDWGEDRSGSVLPPYCHHTSRHLALLLVCLTPTFLQPGPARKPGESSAAFLCIYIFTRGILNLFWKHLTSSGCSETGNKNARG